MNVFLACFLAVLFAKVVGHVLEHQFTHWYVRWSAKRAGARFVAGRVPMPAPSVSMPRSFMSPHGEVQMPDIDGLLLQRDAIVLVADFGERAAKLTADVPVGGSLKIQIEDVDPGAVIMTELFHTSVALWKALPPSFVAHMRREKAARDMIADETQAAEDGRTA